MSKLLLVLILALFSCKTFAQSYQPGFIIKTNSDTVKGFIEYKRWDRSPLEISFKNSPEGSVVVYDPLEIKSFSVANETYESAIVEVDVSPHKIGELSYISTPDFVKDTVFMLVLVRGEKSLLYLKDRNAKNHFYIINEEQQYQPLIYKQYLVGGGAGKAIAQNQNYRGVLVNYLKDCASIQSKLRKITYDVRPLKNLFDHYYACTNKTMQQEMERKEGKLELGVVAGASLSMLKFSGSPDYIANNDYGTSINPTIGFFCDLKILRSNNWTISNDIMYSSFDVTGEGSKTSVNGPAEYVSKTSFNYHYLKTHHMLQVNLLKKHILFLAAGFSTGLVLKDNYDVTIYYRGSSTPSKRPFATRNLEIGYLGGIGFRSGKWSAEARYEISSGISDYLDLNETTTRIHFLLKYRVR